jgi:hypothetical protein
MTETYVDDRLTEIAAERDEFKTEAADALEEGRFARVGEIIDNLNQLANAAGALPRDRGGPLNESVTNTTADAANGFAEAIIEDAQQKRWQAMPQAALVEAIEDATGLSRGSEFVAVDLTCASATGSSWRNRSESGIWRADRHRDPALAHMKIPVLEYHRTKLHEFWNRSGKPTRAHHVRTTGWGSACRLYIVSHSPTEAR